MLLTSVERIKTSLGIVGTKEDALLARLVASASSRVERWLKRPLQLAERTLVISPYFGQRKFYLPAYPVVSVASVKYDPSGLFAGAETTLTGWAIVAEENPDEGKRALTLPLPSYPGYPEVMANKSGSLRVTYTGGLAAHAVSSTWTATNTGLTVGKYLLGATSGMVGKITAKPTGGVTFNLLAGVPEAGETVTEYTSFSVDLQSGGLSAASGITTTLTACVTPSLGEAAPALVEMCEMYIRYLRTNRFNFESASTAVDDTTRVSRAGLMEDYFAIPEVRDMARAYKNTLIL